MSITLCSFSLSPRCRDPAALDAFLRSSSKSVSSESIFVVLHRSSSAILQSSNATNSSSPHRVSSTAPQLSPDQSTARLSPGNATNIFNQNTTNNTNVQITQNTYNFNTNPTVTTNTSPTPAASAQQQPIVPAEYPRVVNQTIGSQTNVNVFLNQTVIQQPTTIASSTSATTNPQQQMFAINIRGNQTLIPLTMLTRFLNPKNAAQGTNVSRSIDQRCK